MYERGGERGKSGKGSVVESKKFLKIDLQHCGYERGNHDAFLSPTIVGRRRPFRLKFALKMTHPFEKR